MKEKRSKGFKAAALSIAAIATSLLVGMTSACSTDTPDEDNDKTTTKVDTQTIKNGNFEFYSDNKGLYPISSPDNWSGSTKGNSSSSMSGVIDTGKKHWDYLTDPTLPKTLEDNADLKSDDKNKKDYNGALTDDMLYVDMHKATKSDAKDEDKVYIANPFTHSYKYDEDGKVLDADGNEVKTYENEDGELFLDEKFETPLETSVLMLHNYRNSYYTGTESYFDSSTTVTLEANTACEISLWVKTCDLTFDGAESERTDVKSERGAYIKVKTQVGGNTIDDVVIKNINTEQLIKDNDDIASTAKNGWLQYTVFIEASSFAETTVSLTLGLGEDDVYTVEGYAFFDDVTLTKYLNAAEMNSKNSAFNETTIKAANTTQPLAPDATTEFRVDKIAYQTNDKEGNLTTKEENYNSADRHFFIDFANSSTINKTDWTLDSSKVSAGLTVESTSGGKYVCTKPDGTNNYTNETTGTTLPSGVYVPPKLASDGLNLKNDLITTVNITDAADWKFKDGYKYNDVLTEALKSASTKLPGVSEGKTDALVIVSADGAAYEAIITDDTKFILGDDEYAMLSFWIKTSNMSGKTAATVTVIDCEDEENNANFTVDSTSVSPVKIGDDKDVYDGWVKCFVRVSNTSGKNDRKFKLKINFGPTTIKGTDKTSYKAGWLAVADFSYMTLDEDAFGYTSGNDYTATLSMTETQESGTHVFDTAENGINRTDLAKPASYDGVYGASLNVAPTGKPAGEYDARNVNPLAGLVKKEDISVYNAEKEGAYWLNRVKSIFDSDLTNADETKIWNTIFDKYSVQPLIIVNSAQTLNSETKVFNYGYIGSSSTVSGDGYVPVSVRVKASAGAIANVYLVEDKENSRDILSYSLPKYTFWYDDDGNVLKENPDTTDNSKEENIAYTLRKDGLYEKSGDDKLYANTYNLYRYYDPLWYETSSFYAEIDGKTEKVSFNYVKQHQGEIFYANAEKTAYAPHHLVSSKNGNNKIYEYKEGVGDGACYYYFENNKVNKNKVVYGFDRTLATVRYESKTEDSTPYQFTIDTTTAEGAKYADKWVNVTFYVHAGSEEKKYRLELWSGKRDEVSSYSSVDANDDSYVVFDYCGFGESLDESAYNNLLTEYTDKIKADYKSKLGDVEFDDLNASIADLEKLAKENSVVSSYDYVAKYYAFSLYDSEAFIPFNGETAEKGQNGYSYEYSDYEENLAFFKITDDGVPAGGEDTNASYTMSAFIDYSVVDKDIDIIGEPQPPENNTDDTDDTTKNNSNFWLLLASIILVAAIIVAMVALFIRDFVKKHVHKKTAGKNSYNFNKNKRYVKKYVKANGEAPAITEGEVDESLLSDPAESAPENEQTSSESETGSDNADEAPADSEQSAEENKPEEGNGESEGEQPATEGTEETKPEDGDKPEEKPADGDKPDGGNE